MSQDSVEFTGGPDVIERDKPFTLAVAFESEAAGKIRFFVDEGRTIYPSSIDVGGDIVNGKLKDSFVIHGGGSSSVSITCSLRGRTATRLFPIS